MLSRVLPFWGWLSRYEPAQLPSDLAAGLIVAVVLVPQAMAYAALAGLPPAVGLYAALLAQLVYPLFGSSRQLSVGPAALDSLLTAAALAGLAAHAPLLVLAPLLAVSAGALQLALGFLRAGYVANFLSRPVISGFTSAAALLIATTQLGETLGLSVPRDQGPFATLLYVGQHAAQIQLWPPLIAGSSLLCLRLLPRLVPKLPAPLLVIVAHLSLAWLLDLGRAGVRLVGDIPAGLPSLTLTSAEPSLWLALVPHAATLALVSYIETLTGGSLIARRHDYRTEPDQELRALGLSNLAAGLFGGYPVAGGLSRSAVADRAGAKSGLASLFSGVLLALTLLWLTPVLRWLPKAALSAIVLAAVFSLVDPETPRRLWRVKRNDFWLLGLTFVATLLSGVLTGILVGAGASLALFIVRTTRPHYALLGRMPGTEAYLNVARHPNAEACPGVQIVRMDAQLYFGNVSFLERTLRKLERKSDAPLAALVLDMSGVNGLDSSAVEALEELDHEYTRRHIRLLFSRVKGPVRDVLEASGMLARLRSERRLFTRTHDAASCAARYAGGDRQRCTAVCYDLSEGVDPGAASRARSAP